MPSFPFRPACIAAPVLAGLTAAGSAHAQDYAEITFPNRSVRMLVAQAAGGPTDLVARVYATRLSELLGQQIVVDNRPGAGGSITGDISATMPGYDVTSWYAVLAPAGTAPAIIGKLSKTSNAAVTSPETKAKLVASGIDIDPLTPQQMVTKLSTDYERWGKVVRAAGMKPN